MNGGTALVRSRASGAAAAALTVIGAAALVVGTASADPVTVVNALRTEGCGDRPGVGSPVRRDAALDDVARALAAAATLAEAIERTGFPVQSAQSFHVRGSREDDAVRRILAERHCASINDPRYEEIGAFAEGTETWIVLAVRHAPPQLDPADTARRVLALVNAARAEARRCGATEHGPAPPLALSSVLTAVAAAHARDMAARRELGHEGSDGSLVGDRIARAGYAWSASGENVASGHRDADAVVAAWLASPGHCATLMTPEFTQMGVAFAVVPDAEPPIYWAQVFATPR
ncbi:MAG TPA: CAP domain-containing protein [Gammaproteobacteria bacterium]